MHKSFHNNIARIAMLLAACSATLAGSQSCPVVLNSLLVTKAGSGTGVVTSTPSGISCGTSCTAVFATDASITLTAKADAGSVFAGWSGMCNGAAGSVSIGPLPVNAGCTASFTSNTPSTGPSGAHPRLWLSDSATLTRLTASARANSADWLRLKDTCDTKSPSYEYQGQEQFRYISAYSLCYRMVKAISGDAAAAPYGKKAIDLLQSTSYPVLSFSAYSTDAGYGIRNYVPAMVIAYDWLADYPGMTTALKGQITSRVKAWLTWFAANGYSRNEYIANYDTGYMIAQVFSGIAFYNEDPESATLWSNALTHYNSARTLFDKSMPGGHWPEGWNYGATVYQQYLWAASALKMSTNDASYLNFNWLSNNVIFKMNAISPDGKFFYDDGTWSGSGHGYPSLEDMIAAGYAYGWSSANGQIARSYIDRVSAGGGSFNYPLEEWKTFLFYDPASQASSLSSLAKSYHAKGTGLVTMRSDWGLASGTWASFMAGPYLSYEGEQDKDQGHIEIYKGAPLLIDTSHDYYGPSYTTNTLFHNSYTLEKRTDTSYAGQDLYTTDCPNPTGSNPIGINAYADNGNYVFSSGEFSGAYQTKPVDPSICGASPATWLNRSTLYLRPNLFVVYDQVQKASNQTALVPTMHLHFPTSPTAQGGSNRQLSLDNGTGRLQMVTVLPATSSSVVQAETANGNAGPGVSNWHLSVAYADPSPMYQKFLTVMRAGQSTAAYTFPNVAAISGTNVSGSFISGLLAIESATPIAVVFAEGGAPRVIPVTVQYQYPAGSTTQNYVAKLKPNAFYAVTSSSAGGLVSVSVTESTSGTKTDAAGVLAFSL